MPQVRVKIDGNLIDNVVRIEMGVNVAKATDGHPADARPRIQAIVITRLSDRKSDWWKWAAKPWLDTAKSGEIQFLDPTHEDRTMKTWKWEDGWISSYSEDVPHVQYQKEAPMTETIQVCARKFDMDGHIIEAYKK